MIVQNICDAVYPILFATSICGLSSIFVKKQNGNQKLKSLNILKILNILYLMVITCLIYYTVCNFRNKRLKANYASGVAKLGIIFNILAEILLIYIIYFINIAKSPKIISAIKDIIKIDQMFGDLGQKLNYHKHFTYEISVILIGLIAIFGKAIISQIYISRNIFDGDDNNIYFTILFPSLISYLVQSNFVLLVSLVHERFAVVNALLHDLAKEHQLSLKSKLKQAHQLIHGLKRIEVLMEIHDFLTDIGDKLNDAFKLQILTCLTTQFLIEVFTVFYLYYETLVLKDKMSAIIWLMWTAWTTLEIFFVTITCHLTCRESRNTGTIIHKVIMAESDPFMKKKLMIFSQQVHHRPLQFAACGLFPIDATLIFTIAGAAATYLLIMLQFQEGIEAQCSNVTLYNT